MLALLPPPHRPNIDTIPLGKSISTVTASTPPTPHGDDGPMSLKEPPGDGRKDRTVHTPSKKRRTLSPSISAKSFYTIKKGDNLSKIAREAYGHPIWSRLYSANRGRVRNPNLIY